MSGSPARRADVEALVGAYRADPIAAGMFAGHPATSVARMFFTRVGVDGWARLPLGEQCTLPLKERRVVGWLIVTGRVRPSPDYLVACRPYLGEVAAHHHQAFHERFQVTSAELWVQPGRDPSAVVGAGQGRRRVRSHDRATDHDDDPDRATRAGRGGRAAPVRESRG